MSPVGVWRRAAFVLVVATVAGAAPGVLVAADAHGARGRPHRRTHRPACGSVTLRIEGLPKRIRANVGLIAPRRERRLLRRARRALDRSGHACLPAARRPYTLLIRPDRLSRTQIAYPTTATRALAVQRIRFRPAPGRPLTLTASYLDVAPISTVLLPAGSVLAPATRSLPASGRLTLRKNAATRGLRAGKILVAAAGPGLPHGILAKVRSVRHARGVVLVRTVPVLPFEAFTRGAISVSVGGAHAATGSARAAGARARIAADEPGPFKVGCGPNGALTAVLTPKLEPHVSFELGWEDPYLFDPVIHGRFMLEPGIALEAAFSTLAGVRCTASYNLAEYEIGSVETDFCPTITFKLAAVASVSAALGERLEEKLTGGLEGGIGASFRFGATTPSLTPEGTLKPFGRLEGAGGERPESWQGYVAGGIGPALIVQCGAEGVGGFGPELGLEDQAKLSGSPSGWAIKGGVEASVGVALDVLGYSYSDSVNVPVGEELAIKEGTWSAIPSLVLDPLITAANETSLKAEWQPPAYGGEGGLKEYLLDTIPQGSCPQAPPASGSQPVEASATSAIVERTASGEALKPDSPYTVCIFARSGSGNAGRVSAVSATTTPETPPLAPAIESVAGGVGSCSSGEAEGPLAHIVFKSRGSFSEPPVERYVISWAGDGTDGGETVGAEAAGSSVCFPLPSFLAATGAVNPYIVTVSAQNKAGSSAPSEQKSFADVVAPFAPSGVKASVPVPGTYVHVSWNAPSQDGGDPISTYVITETIAGQSRPDCPGSSSVETLSTQTSGTVLLDCVGVPYVITVSARSAAGGSPASAPSSDVIAITAPEAPSALSAASSGRKVTLHWSEPGSDGGSPLTSFLVIWSGEGYSGQFTVPVPAHASKIPNPCAERHEGCGEEGHGGREGSGLRYCAQLTLPGGGTYTVGVLAANAAGLGPAASARVKVTASKPSGGCPPREARHCSPPRKAAPRRLGSAVGVSLWASLSRLASWHIFSAPL